MEQSLKARCEQFIRNRDVIKSTLIWESTYVYPVCAAIFTDKEKVADADTLKQSRSILKEHTGVFSNFRGPVELAAISMLATDYNPEGKMQSMLKVYDYLKKHFFTSSYLVLAAMVIADLAEPHQYEEVAIRTRRLYERMKAKHPFLTSGEDSVYAALLALSPMSDEQLIQDMERCYDQLHGEFFSGNAIQSLTHVLALGEGTANEKCRKTMDLFNILKNKGHKYGTSYELATLGVLALLPVEPETLAQQIIEVDEYLSQQKGYGFFGTTRKQRLMHAGMLVSMEYVQSADRTALNPAAISSAVSLVIAEQVAICCAIAAASSASSSSN